MIFLSVLLLLLIVPFLYSLQTKNPLGTGYNSGLFLADQVEFFQDLSYEKEGEIQREHEIFKEQIKMIEEAQKFLLLDIFLYNDEYDREKMEYPAQVKEMTDVLIQKKKDNPEMPIVFITDPINNFYGAYEQKHLTRLKEAGIEVHVTDHNKMKDSNPLFSGLYRGYIQWFGTSGKGWIPNFFDKEGPKVNLRSILKLANFKGNHRKVMVSDNVGFVSSSNPHDPSGYHSNVAIKFNGTAVEKLLESELILLEKVPEAMTNYRAQQIIEAYDFVTILTEEAIEKSLIQHIKESEKGNQIWVGAFYISDFDILKALGEAANRGVDVKIVADLNKDAFGIEKNGTPNRPALTELVEKHPTIQVRWYNTHGEQYHTKMMYFQREKGLNNTAILGSGNFTRRNLEGYNLETDVELTMEAGENLDRNIQDYFERIWNNSGGEFTLPMDEFKEESFFLRVLWKIQEKTGLCTW